MTNISLNQGLQEAIENLSIKLDLHAKFALKYNEIQINSLLVNIKDLISSIDINNLENNHLSLLKTSVDSFENILPFDNKMILFLDSTSDDIEDESNENVDKLLASKKALKQEKSILEFNIDFIKMLGTSKNNIVAIGANGAGKTSISIKIYQHVQRNGVFIPANRLMYITQIEHIKRADVSFKELADSQKNEKQLTNSSSLSVISKEFGIIINNLISQHVKFLGEIRKQKTDEQTVKLSTLEKALYLWNEIIQHRELEIIDGSTIKVKNNQEYYDLNELSDGEKSILYLISQIFQAPKNGFIIVDEPEINLNKSVLYKVWDELENYRNDCIFIYLTHDINFASSRFASSKFWIKSLDKKIGTWDFEKIDINNIPEPLLLEIIGSRKPILFCEGDRANSTDYLLYSALFPKLNIIPVESCTNVENYTKAFNEQNIFDNSAIGLIDGDHKTQEQIIKLKTKKVYCISFAEIENLLLTEDFLKKMCDENRIFNHDNIPIIKTKVLEHLSTNKEIQATEYIANKINYFHEYEKLQKSKTLNELKQVISNYTNKIDIDKEYKERIAYIEDILDKDDYLSAIKIFNSKAIISFAEQTFNIRRYRDHAINLIKNNENSTLIKLFFPSEFLSQFPQI